jgi:hypothetical protein
MRLKRSGGDTVDGAGGSGSKAPRYYFVLESESVQPTDEFRICP